MDVLRSLELAVEGIVPILVLICMGAVLGVNFGVISTAPAAITPSSSDTLPAAPPLVLFAAATLLASP